MYDGNRKGDEEEKEERCKKKENGNECRPEHVDRKVTDITSSFAGFITRSFCGLTNPTDFGLADGAHCLFSVLALLTQPPLTAAHHERAQF